VKATLSALLFLLAFLLIPGQAQERARGKEGKGMELYSWLDENRNLIFALLPGTNRLKTEEEIKEKPNRISGLNELEKRFSLLAEGEYVTWFHELHQHGFAYPDWTTIKRVEASARKAKIELHGPPTFENSG
jgi:hypothetical protein